MGVGIDIVSCCKGSAVNPHVPVQVSGLGKPEHAEFALVRLLSRVYPEVFGESRRVRESLLAESATVRSLSGVRPNVGGDG